MSPRRLDPNLVRRFRAYGLKHYGSWGSLHIAFEDGNLEPAHFDMCAKTADEEGDAEGGSLAREIGSLNRCRIARLNRIGAHL